MKKAISFIVCILTLSFVAGCSSNKAIAGIWHASMDMTDMMNEEIGKGLDAETLELVEDFQLENLYVIMEAEFTEDGNYEIRLNRDSCVAFYEDMRDQIVDYMYRKYDEMIKANDLDLTVDELLEAAGVSMEDLIAEYEQYFDIDAMVEQSRTSGKYRSRKNKILIILDQDDTQYMDAGEVNGDTMVFTGTEEDNEYAQFYPLTFVKQ